MNLGRQDISATTPTQIIDVRFDADSRIFTCSTPSGFAVYRSFPLTLVRKREITGGTISIVLPLHSSSLLFLVGGGRSPRYPPNKVIFWDDAQGKEVAELEFRERVRGIACRRGTLAVALKRRVVVFEITDTVRHVQEWRTGENERGLVVLATAPGATLMAIPAITTGHLHLVNLWPCPAPPEDHTPGSRPTYHPPRIPPAQPRIDHIVAHNTALATVSLTPSGRMVATTSETGTLIRIWDVVKGQKSHEFRRGMDQAHIYGVAFRPDEKECCAWSDKGTVHVYSLDRVNRTSVLRQVSAFLPGAIQTNYLNSEWSYAQYQLPTPPAHVAHSMSQTNRLGTTHPDAGDEERWTVGWIALPPDTTPQSSPAKVVSPLPSARSKGKGRTETPGSPLGGSTDRKMSGSVTTRQTAKPPTPEYQLVALTFTGGWYRLSLPNNESQDRPGTPEPYPSSGRNPRRSENDRRVGSPQLGGSRRTTEQKKGSPRRNSDAQNDGGKCQLEEFRRFGRWDGWG